MLNVLNRMCMTVVQIVVCAICLPIVVIVNGISAIPDYMMEAYEGAISIWVCDDVRWYK